MVCRKNNRDWKKPFFFLTLPFLSLSLTHCQSSKMLSLKASTRIGVVSLMGNGDLISETKSSQYASLPEKINFDDTLSNAIAKDLQSKGYRQVSAIAIDSKETEKLGIHVHSPFKKIPLKKLKNNPNYDLILVIYPGTSTPPEASGERSQNLDEPLTGYGAYFHDQNNDQHAFGYMNYTINVYQSEGWKLLSTHSYNTSTLLPFSHFSGNYQDLSQSTAQALSVWVDQTSLQNIRQEASLNLPSLIG